MSFRLWQVLSLVAIPFWHICFTMVAIKEVGRNPKTNWHSIDRITEKSFDYAIRWPIKSSRGSLPQLAPYVIHLFNLFNRVSLLRGIIEYCQRPPNHRPNICFLFIFIWFQSQPLQAVSRYDSTSSGLALPLRSLLSCGI